MYAAFSALVQNLNDLLYTYVLIILLVAAGLYFTVRTRLVQVRLLPESIRVVGERRGTATPSPPLRR